MKIRADFVTNSSSSSFTLMVCITKTDGEQYSVRTPLSRRYAETIRKRDPLSAHPSVSSKDALFALLDDIGLANTKAKEDLKNNMPPIKDLAKVEASVIWDSHGESSGLTVHNDSELRAKAKAVMNTKGEDRRKALDDMVRYLEGHPVYAEGAWANETWPVGVFGDDGEKARYGWDEYRQNPEKLAKLIDQEKYSGDDLGVEKLTILPAEKQITHKAELLIDGSRKILKPKRPAKPAAPKEKLDPAEIIPPEKAEAGDAPEIRLDGYRFSYKTVDQVPHSFCQGIFDAEGNIPPMPKVREEIGSFKVCLDYGQETARIAEIYRGDPGLWIDPEAYLEAVQNHRIDTYLSKEEDFRAFEITKEQLSHRCAVFLQLMKYCTSRAVLRKIAEAYPKKKNGTFCKGRVLKIAWLYALNVCEFEGDYNGVPMTGRVTNAYQLYAKAEDDTELTVGVRFWVAGNDIGLEDLATTTNLFSELG